MAVVLEALASYVQNLLVDKAKEEVRMLLGVPDEMKKMEVKLGDLKRFLADADKRNISDETVREWVKEFRGAMYDASDILDLCQLNAMERGPSRDMGCFNPLLFCLRNPRHTHELGRRLKTLNEKLSGIEERSKPFQFLLTSNEDNGIRRTKTSRLKRCETTGGQNKLCSRRETDGYLNKLDLVGEKVEEDTRNLVADLLTWEEKTIHPEHNKVMVFAIVGVGGIGKTTLAKSIFNNEIIEEKFNKKIWLSVNQDFNDNNLLGRAITEAKGGHQEPTNTKADLVRTLMKALKGCKTLLVMDDVWDYQAWVRVLKDPFTNAVAPGSCVLITTRHDTVAQGMRAKKPYHHVDKLDPEDAWSLLKKEVVSNENNESRVDMLKDIGMGIVAKCDGLPLAVKVMGGLLLQKKASPRDWNKVLNDSIWSDSKMSEDLNYAIYLSYQDLNPSLKPCFLHFSLLPKSALFGVDYVVGMWISEGFVHGGSRELEELGREYYDELILRNLIEPNLVYVDHMVCNMHDVVRSFAQYVARDEALAAHNSKMDTISKVKSQMFVRLSLETKGSESNEFEWMSLQAQRSLRTLISVGHIRIKPGDSLDTFSCIRTLHIQDTNVDALAESLVQLKHLRYLSLRNTNISMLPEKIGKMKLLQCIGLRNCHSLTNLPGSIGQLQHLRFLDLIGTCINNVPKGFSSLTNLRKLYNFPAQMDGHLSSLEELGPLTKLIDLVITGLENIPSSSFARKAKLSEKSHLRFLMLTCTSRHGDNDTLLKEDENTSINGQQRIEEVFDELCPPHSSENLTILGYFGRRLPRWMMSTAVDAPLGNLRILMMDDLPYCTEFPDSLCQLPFLELLQIRDAPAIKRVGPEFLQPHNHEHPSAPENLLGSPMKVEVIRCFGIERIGNMPKTQEFTMSECPKLKVLEGMPALRRLDLVDYSMTTLPGYLQDVHPTHQLQIDCDASLLTSIARGKYGPEWVKFCHIQQVKAYADDDDNSIERKWYVFYTRDPFSFKTNISRSDVLQGNASNNYS